MGFKWYDKGKTIKDKGSVTDATQINKVTLKVARTLRIIQLPDVRVIEQILHIEKFPYRQVLTGILSSIDKDK